MHNYLNTEKNVFYTPTSHAIIGKPLAELVGQDEKNTFRVVHEVSLHKRAQKTLYMYIA